jgi:hypothetical protein
MKRSEHESPHSKLIITQSDKEGTPRSSDKKVKENNSPHCSTITNMENTTLIQ